MKSLSVHILCKRSFPGRRPDERQGFEKIEAGTFAGCIKSTSWVFDKGDRTFVRLKALIGGRVYFHSTKAGLSEYGGIVRDIEESKINFDRYGEARLDIVFEPDDECVGVTWRGGNEQRRVVGRLVPAE